MSLGPSGRLDVVERERLVAARMCGATVASGTVVDEAATEPRAAP